VTSPIFFSSGMAQFQNPGMPFSPRSPKLSRIRRVAGRDFHFTAPDRSTTVRLAQSASHPGGDRTPCSAIDHDEKFTRHPTLQFSPGRGDVGWLQLRYDSRPGARRRPVEMGKSDFQMCPGLTPDQQFQSGLFGGNGLRRRPLRIHSVQVA